MKKIKLLIMACALLGVGQAWADDVFKDITTGKITNPSFEDANTVVAEKNSTGTLTTGWNVEAINFGRVAVFNSSSTASGKYNTYGATEPSFGSYYLMIRSNENTESTNRTQTVRQASEMSLTKNTYRVSFDYKVAQCTGNTLKLTVSALYGSSSLAKTEIDIPQITKNTSYFNSIDWTRGFFELELTETKNIKIDITCITRSKNDGSKTTFALLDNFKLEWNLTQSLSNLLSEANTFYEAEGDSYIALKAVIDATDTSETDPDKLEAQYNALDEALDLAKNHRKPWLTAKTNAETAIANGDYMNVTGEEKTNLQSAIDAAEPSNATNYDSAKSDLETKTSTFTSAKASYDALVAEITKAKALGIDDATADGYASNSSSTSESVTTSTKNLKTAEYDFVSTVYTEPLTLAEGDWRATKIKIESKSEHWDDVKSSYKSSDGWNENSWECSYSQNLELPAGSYVFKVAGRRSNNSAMWINVKNGETTLGSINDFPKATSGLGINTSGATDFATGENHTYANSGNGRGWEWRYVQFTLEEKATVTVAINGSTGEKNQWINFTDYTVLADNALNVSLYEYFKAINAATTARDNATYTNVDGKEKADLLAAIAVDETLDKSSETDIDAATTSLTNARTAFTDADAVTNYNALATAISTAQTIVDAKKNVGSGIFQIPTSAQTTLVKAITIASGIKSNVTKTKDDAATATTTLNSATDTYNATELNSPDPAKKYFIKVKTSGHAKLGNAVGISTGSTSANNPTGYTFKADATPAPYLANNYQSFTLTKVSGNNYILSIVGPTETVYLTNGDKNGSTAGHKVLQIQANPDSEKAMEFKFAPSPNEGAFVIYNTEANATIACQSGGSLYTESGNADFSIEEAVASVPVAISSEVKLATRIFPFTPVLPSGIKAYSCAETEGDALTLVEVAEPQANIPYILYAENGYSGDALTGYGTATADSYTPGLLTGVYTSTPAPVGSYVLQNNNEGLAFYKVAEGKQPTVGAYRAYLTVPNNNARALFFSFDDDNQTTAVKTIEALTSGKSEIYNTSGVRQNALQKGMNILKMEDGSIRKVMIK